MTTLKSWNLFTCIFLTCIADNRKQSDDLKSRLHSFFLWNWLEKMGNCTPHSARKNFKENVKFVAILFLSRGFEWNQADLCCNDSLKNHKHQIKGPDRCQSRPIRWYYIWLAIYQAIKSEQSLPAEGCLSHLIVHIVLKLDSHDECK